MGARLYESFVAACSLTSPADTVNVVLCCSSVIRGQIGRVWRAELRLRATVGALVGCTARLKRGIANDMTRQHVMLCNVIRVLRVGSTDRWCIAN